LAVSCACSVEKEAEVLPVLSAPEITAQPGEYTRLATSATATLNVAATGNGKPYYEWKKFNLKTAVKGTPKNKSACLRTAVPFVP
jgi:hypothetical protein